MLHGNTKDMSPVLKFPFSYLVGRFRSSVEVNSDRRVSAAELERAEEAIPSRREAASRASEST